VETEETGETGAVETIEGIVEVDLTEVAISEGGRVMIVTDQGKIVRVRERTVPAQVMIDDDQQKVQEAAVSVLRQWVKSFGCHEQRAHAERAGLKGLPLAVGNLIGPRRRNFLNERDFLLR
jgi:hypothetical protein